MIALFFPIISYAQADVRAEVTDSDGFTLIFDGRTFNSWADDLVYWNIKDSVLKGTVTPETILKENSFIVWQGG